MRTLLKWLVLVISPLASGAVAFGGFLYFFKCLECAITLGACAAFAVGMANWFTWIDCEIARMRKPGEPQSYWKPPL